MQPRIHRVHLPDGKVLAQTDTDNYFFASLSYHPGSNRVYRFSTDAGGLYSVYNGTTGAALGAAALPRRHWTDLAGIYSSHYDGQARRIVVCASTGVFGIDAAGTVARLGDADPTCDRTHATDSRTGTTYVAGMASGTAYVAAMRNGQVIKQVGLQGFAVAPRLTLSPDGRNLPYLGFWGPDDVCLGEWARVLAVMVATLSGQEEITYMYDEGEQGQPAFAFSRSGEQVHISIMALPPDCHTSAGGSTAGPGGTAPIYPCPCPLHGRKPGPGPRPEGFKAKLALVVRVFPDLG